jgi:hypothetical protein
MESQKLQQAIKAIQFGDKPQAFNLLRQILLVEPQNATAWLWMSRVVDTREQQIDCLNRVLKIEPDNQQALNALEDIRLREVLQTARSIVTLEASQEPRRLGEYLVEQNLITRDQLKIALTEQNKTRTFTGHESLGDIILRHGWLDANTLAKVLVHQQQYNMQPSVGMPPERLGDYLINEQILSPDLLAKALAEQAAMRQRGRYVALGEILLRHHYLKPETLSQVLELQRQDFFSRYGS